MQDLLTQNDKVNAVMKNLELWKINIERNIFDMFPTFENFVRAVKQELTKAVHEPLGCFSEIVSIVF
jgi:hypothetical protein